MPEFFRSYQRWNQRRAPSASLTVTIPSPRLCPKRQSTHSVASQMASVTAFELRALLTECIRLPRMCSMARLAGRQQGNCYEWSLFWINMYLTQIDNSVCSQQISRIGLVGSLARLVHAALEARPVASRGHTGVRLVVALLGPCGRPSAVPRDPASRPEATIDGVKESTVQRPQNPSRWGTLALPEADMSPGHKRRRTGYRWAAMRA